MKKLVSSIALASALSVAVMAGNVMAGETQQIRVGTGGVTGVYYPTGNAIAKFVNKGAKEHGVKLKVESTGGSIYNLNAIRSGELEMGVVQSDWQYHAYNGTSKFSDQGPNTELRAMFSIHAEPFTVVARKDANIEHFMHLEGKRVNIGNPGSGQRGTMEVVMNELGWTNTSFKLVSELKASEQASALCDNKVDAIIYTAGHPNGSIAEATATCDAVLVDVAGPYIKNLIDENPYYRSANIPANMYRGNLFPTTTFGVGATFVTSMNTSDEAVYQTVKAVFENFKEFKKQHPAYKTLKKEQMIKDGLSAPLHPGAERYYKEVGLM